MHFWDQLDAEMVIDDEATGSNVAFQSPLLGFRSSGGCIKEVGGARGVGMHVVESVLNERVHHEACRPDTHSDPNLTLLFCFQGEAACISSNVG